MKTTATNWLGRKSCGSISIILLNSERLEHWTAVGRTTTKIELYIKMSSPLITKTTRKISCERLSSSCKLFKPQFDFCVFPPCLIFSLLAAQHSQVSFPQRRHPRLLKNLSWFVSSARALCSADSRLSHPYQWRVHEFAVHIQFGRNLTENCSQT